MCTSPASSTHRPVLAHDPSHQLPHRKEHQEGSPFLVPHAHTPHTYVCDAGRHEVDVGDMWSVCSGGESERELDAGLLWRTEGGACGVAGVLFGVYGCGRVLVGA